MNKERFESAVVWVATCGWGVYVHVLPFSRKDTVSLIDFFETPEFK